MTDILIDDSDGHAYGLIAAAIATVGASNQEIKPKNLDIFVESGSHDFYMFVKGPGFNELPDFLISVPPLINFNLHSLANKDHGDWYLRIRQRGWGEGVGRARASVSNGRNISIHFKMPKQRTLFKTLGEALACLKEGGYSVRSVQMQVSTPTILQRRPHERDELALLQLFNKRRYETLSQNRGGIKLLPSDDVVALIDSIKQRAAIEPLPDNVEAFLNS